MCSSVPKDTAVCLVCGQYLCFRQSCCQQQSSYECVHVSYFYWLNYFSVCVSERSARSEILGIPRIVEE
jgi:hypothetical protein